MQVSASNHIPAAAAHSAVTPLVIVTAIGNAVRFTCRVMAGMKATSHNSLRSEADVRAIYEAAAQ